MNEATNLPTHVPRPTGSPAATIGHHLLARWPLLLGLLALFLNLANGADPHVTAMIIIIASTCYLAAAAIGSPRSVWMMVAVVSVTIVLARVTGLDPTATVLVLGAGFAVLGFLRGSTAGRRESGRQALAFMGFSAIALIAMTSGPTAAVYLAAAATIGHAGWDVIHLVRNKVVSRSLAEACLVLDLGLGIALLLTAWTTLPR